jgi:hypothetical protein
MTFQNSVGWRNENYVISERTGLRKGLGRLRFKGKVSDVSSVISTANLKKVEKL